MVHFRENGTGAIDRTNRKSGISDGKNLVKQVLN